MTDRLSDFLDLSVEITCFTRFELLGTGEAEAYLQTARHVVGNALDDLLDAYARVHATTESGSEAREKALRLAIFGDARLGPIARAITKLWYIGIWYCLPKSWTESFGALPNDGTFTVSANAYAQGLLWTAIGAHPPGAKAQGYASWAAPPVIPSFKNGKPQSPAGAAALMQTAPGHVSPQHAVTPQHPPAPEGPSA